MDKSKILPSSHELSDYGDLMKSMGTSGYVRKYSLFALVILGIGNTIGCGLFAFTGLAAQYCGGPAVFIAFIGAGVASSISATVYAEFASKYPLNGSTYLYSSKY